MELNFRKEIKGLFNPIKLKLTEYKALGNNDAFKKEVDITIYNSLLENIKTNLKDLKKDNETKIGILEKFLINESNRKSTKEKKANEANEAKKAEDIAGELLKEEDAAKEKDAIKAAKEKEAKATKAANEKEAAAAKKTAEERARAEEAAKKKAEAEEAEEAEEAKEKTAAAAAIMSEQFDKLLELSRYLDDSSKETEEIIQQILDLWNRLLGDDVYKTLMNTDDVELDEFIKELDEYAYLEMPSDGLQRIKYKTIQIIAHISKILSKSKFGIVWKGGMATSLAIKYIIWVNDTVTYDKIPDKIIINDLDISLITRSNEYEDKDNIERKYLSFAISVLIQSITSKMLYDKTLSNISYIVPKLNPDIVKISFGKKNAPSSEPKYKAFVDVDFEHQATDLYVNILERRGPSFNFLFPSIRDKKNELEQLIQVNDSNPFLRQKFGRSIENVQSFISYFESLNTKIDG